MCVSNSGVSHRCRRDRTERGHGFLALRFKLLDPVLDFPQLIRHFLICVKLDVVTSVFISDDFLFEPAVVETGYGEFCLTTRPLRHREVAFACIRANGRTCSNKLVVLGIAKSHLKDRAVFSKQRVCISRIPRRTRNENVVSAA